MMNILDMQAVPSSRSISQILSKAGFKSAGVRLRGCAGYDVPAGAAGYGCAEMVCGPWGGHRWRGVEISWYGPAAVPPFEALAETLEARGYAASDVKPRSLNSGVPSITVWFAGADRPQLV